MRCRARPGLRVVLLRHVVGEEDVGQRLEPVRVASRDVERDGIVVADVLGERLAAASVEDDDPGLAGDAVEEVVLAALVVVEAADHALPRERDVRLAGRLRQQRLAPHLHDPAARVLVHQGRQADDPLDHALFTPLARTKSLTE